jgi:hypothetical protein
MKQLTILGSTIVMVSGLLLCAACGDSTDSGGTGGTSTSSSTTASSSGSGGGDGGQGNTAGQGGSTGGAGGSSTSGSGGSGGSFPCGDDGLSCTAPQICVTFVVTAGPSETKTWECHDDPCAPAPLDCICGAPLCGTGPGTNCQMHQGDLECHSGGVCAAPDTPIATPQGYRAIEELTAGDLVYSIHEGRLQAVAVTRTSRRAVTNHAVVEVTLQSGAVLRISGPHPTADGRRFSDLFPGSMLGDQEVTAVATMPYDHSHTYDILPDSDSGTYLAAGALIGTTLPAR